MGNTACGTSMRSRTMDSDAATGSGSRPEGGLGLRKKFHWKYWPRAMATPRAMGTPGMSEIARERMGQVGQGPGQNHELQ